MSADTDRYFTPAELLDLVFAQWGVIDLDPCWDPECAVQAVRASMQVRVLRASFGSAP